MTWPGSDSTLRMTRYSSPALMTKGTKKRSVRALITGPKASGRPFGERRTEIARGQLFAGEEDQAQAGDERVLDCVRDDDQRQRGLRIGADRAQGSRTEELLGTDVARARRDHD